MRWTDQQVLVTGAGGFIGSHLVERLVELGAKVRALIHYNSSGSYGWLEHSQYRREIDFVLGDLRDRDSVCNAVRGVQYVFHLGALIAIPYSYYAPDSYIQTNVVGTLNVLQAARETGVARVVHTSTSEVYGTARYVPIDELHPLQGQSPYSASKIGADKLAEAFYLSFELPVITVRPFNTYGPRQSARAVIPTIITQCLTRGKASLGNLSPIRDLNFVTDTVEGLVKAAACTNAIGQTINLGTGKEISVGNLANLIATLLGRTLQIESDESRVRPEGSEVERLLADNRLARTLFDWSPTVSLADGLKRTIAWFEKHIDDYKSATYSI